MADDRIMLAHGGGGVLMRELIEGVIVPALGGSQGALTDAAPVPGADQLVMTTDSFVVKPLFFRGGDIGTLCVHGTVNDLAVSGAEPLALSMSLILEEGIEIETVRCVVDSAYRAAQACGVRIVTGDTKVVAKGEADQLFVTTAGVGVCRADVNPGNLREGDCVLINGPIADHGIAVMSERAGIQFETKVQSDSASVWPHVRALIDADIDIRAMRDPTRGGLAACCVELAEASKVTIALDEQAIPIRPETRAACEMLGLDPLTVANEGKVVAVVSADDAEKALAIMKVIEGGEHAAIIGHVTAKRAMPAYMKTRFGGERLVEMPYGEELPRIC